jgi:hypothetical protein
MSPKGMLSPEQEDALRSAAVVLLDRFFADIGHLEAGGDFADTDMVEYLPPRFLPKYDHVFAKEFLVCVATVAWKLVNPGHSMLACVGEGLALHALVTRLRSPLLSVCRQPDRGLRQKRVEAEIRAGQ